jgi:hypothetical protein
VRAPSSPLHILALISLRLANATGTRVSFFEVAVMVVMRSMIWIIVVRIFCRAFSVTRRSRSLKRPSAPSLTYGKKLVVSQGDTNYTVSPTHLIITGSEHMQDRLGKARDCHLAQSLFETCACSTA